MESLRCYIIDQNNGTACTRTKALYPARISHDGSIATEISAETAATEAMSLTPQAHLDGLDTVLRTTESTAPTSPLFPLGSILSDTAMATYSTSSITDLSISATKVSGMVIPTLASTTDAPVSNPHDIATSNSASGSTIFSSSVETSPTPSETPASIAQPQNTAGPNRGAVAGGVIAAVAIILIAFSTFMCYRRRRYRSADDVSKPTWKQIEEAEKAETLAMRREVKGGDVLDDKHLDIHQKTIPCATSSTTLGEPGPSLDIDENQRRVLPYLNLRSGHKYTISNRSSGSGMSNPFATPTESTQDADSSLEADEPTRSQIGLALSRYSTNTIKTASGTSQQSVRPALPHLPTITPLVEPPKVNNEDEKSMRSSTVDHKRASSISAITDGVEGDVAVFSVDKTVTYRRHSLAPRLINILAGTSHSDGGQRVSRADSRSDNQIGRESFNRTRSASPTVTNDKYTGSPAKLNGHFGIETWGMLPGRTSSEHSVRHNVESLPSKTPEISIDRQSTTKSSMRRPEHVDAIEHRRYPPTSFPMIDRSLSQAKRRLREQSMENIGMAGQLPSGVAVERHKGV